MVELARDREGAASGGLTVDDTVIHLSAASTHAIDSLISACSQYAPRANAPCVSSASGRLVGAELSEGTALASYTKYAVRMFLRQLDSGARQWCLCGIVACTRR